MTLVGCCFLHLYKNKIMSKQQIPGVHLVDPPGIIGNVLLVLRVDSIDLPVSGRLGKEGGEEELREPVQSTAQVIRADIEVVVGVVARRERIEAAPVLAQVLAVFILVRELLCAWLCYTIELNLRAYLKPT